MEKKEHGQHEQPNTPADEREPVGNKPAQSNPHSSSEPQTQAEGDGSGGGDPVGPGK